ncbi:MAG: hypothetical protein ACR2GK_05390 [Gemmatimonadaceae bacterium]
MRPILRSPLAFALGFLTLACSRDRADGGAGGASADGTTGVVEIVARGLSFEAPDSIPSGWTTVRLRNDSEMVHFALLQRLPEGAGLVEHQREVAPVFQQGFDLLKAGKGEAAMAKFGELPPWFPNIVFAGGVGLLDAGQTAETTLYLEPGRYLIECYVKTGGIFHSYNPSPGAYGMVREITVTSDSSRNPEPSATVNVTVSSARGIEVAGQMVPGTQTVAVLFEDQKAHEHFIGHDVNLVRLEDNTDMAALAAWMDWSQATGLDTPAPAVFLGGAQEMPAGGKSYVTVTLEAGRYAWIAEVPNPAAKNMIKEFTVGG